MMLPVDRLNAEQLEQRPLVPLHCDPSDTVTTTAGPLVLSVRRPEYGHMGGLGLLCGGARCSSILKYWFNMILRTS